jgi:hypothetical protein
MWFAMWKSLCFWIGAIVIWMQLGALVWLLVEYWRTPPDRERWRGSVGFSKQDGTLLGPRPTIGVHTRKEVRHGEDRENPGTP